MITTSAETISLQQKATTGTCH